MTEYRFSNNWFETSAKIVWELLLPQAARLSRVLEIGTFEGAASCFLINHLAPRGPMEIHCVDSWEGGEDQVGLNMSEIEANFLSNIRKAVDEAPNPVALTIHKGRSDVALPQLLTSGKQNYFDLIYVDGSHLAADVILDALLAFKMLSVGGLLIFDDYIWSDSTSGSRAPHKSPKMAIDAFTNIYFDKIGFLIAPINQIYLQKIAD